MSIIISMLALLATFYQLYLQQVHNAKSLKPLGKVDLLDLNRRLVVWIANNGMGPMIIDRITFFKDGKVHCKSNTIFPLSHPSITKYEQVQYLREKLNEQRPYGREGYTIKHIDYA